MSGSVIFVEDDSDLLKAQTQGLELAGFEVTALSRATEALARIDADFPGVIMTDIRMPGMDGLELFRRVREIDPDIPMILLTGHGDVAMAVQALKDGAYDFITKPFVMDNLVQSLRRALDKRQLVLENRLLRQVHENEDSAEAQLLGNSSIMRHLRQTLQQLAEAEVDILITGDTGVGKERAARTLHRLSARRNRPFIQVNCAALPEESFNAELFGVDPSGKPGAYGARRTIGRLEKAQKGVLFLDDVEGLSLPQQARLLRLVEAREFWPLGAEEPRHLDIRIVATTTADLAEAVAAGRFRADLYYLLSSFSLRMPPLSERKDDVGLLFQHFLVSACARFKRPIPAIGMALHSHIRSHEWLGNVRELEHFAERFALGLADWPSPSAGFPAPPPSLAERVADYEAELLREALKSAGGSAKQAMSALRLPSKTFYDKLNRYGIDIGDYRKNAS